MTKDGRGEPSFGKRLVLKALGLTGRLFSRGGGRHTELPSAPGRILLMELWGVGDVVLSTPAIEALKGIYPDSRLTVLAKPYASEILKNCPHVDEIISFEFPWTRLHGKYNLLKWDLRGMWSLVRRLRRKRFDLSVDVRGDIRSNLLMSLSGASARVGFEAFEGDYTLTHVVARTLAQRHRVCEWHDITRYLGPGGETRPPRLWVTRDEAAAATKRAGLDGVKGIVAGIHVGASNRFKKWGLDRYEVLAKHLQEKYGARIVFFSDPDGYGSSLRVGDSIMISGWSLREAMALISKCDLFFCNDGGPMHIASALGVPTVAVFGPTLSWWFGPCGEKSLVVEKDVCEFKPCWDYCEFDEPRCLRELTPEDVISRVDQFLSEIIK